MSGSMTFARKKKEVTQKVKAAGLEDGGYRRAFFQVPRSPIYGPDKREKITTATTTRVRQSHQMCVDDLQAASHS